MQLKSLLALSAISFVLVGCGKPEEGAAPIDDSATGRAKTTIEQQQKDASKDRSEEHLARLRELAEKQEARRLEDERKHKSFAKGAKEGAAAPLIEFKY
jgi:hypothetical protein